MVRNQTKRERGEETERSRYSREMRDVVDRIADHPINRIEERPPGLEAGARPILTSPRLPTFSPFPTPHISTGFTGRLRKLNPHLTPVGEGVCATVFICPPPVALAPRWAGAR